MIKKNLAAAITSILVIVIVAFMFVIQADVLSISLSGLSYSYRDLLHHYLGEPVGAGVVEARRFCGGPKIEQQLRNKLEEMVCVPLENYEYKPGQCDPVATVGNIPTYVAPFFDRIEVRLAITSGNLEELRQYLVDYGRSIFPQYIDLNGIGYIGNSVVAKAKIVNIKQCSGYGYMSIQQNYFLD